MPKTKKSIFSQNLAKYDVFIEDTSPSSPYFNVTNLPPKLAGGRNSFLLGGSRLLQNGSRILVEILDAKGNTIYTRTIPKYSESNSRLVSVEIYDTTAIGFSTIIIMGMATVQADGSPIPPEWQGKYNVRWSRQILTDHFAGNSSPLRFLDTPTMFVEEKRYNNVYNPRYTTQSLSFPVRITPLSVSSTEIGYRLEAVAPVTFSADYVGGKFTGSLQVNDTVYNVDMPITSILNSSTAISYNYLISKRTAYVTQMLLQTGSYQTGVDFASASVTSSVRLEYPILQEPTGNPAPTSFARIRIVNLNTVSGEIRKIRLYQTSVTDTGEFKLIGDIPTSAQELLVRSTVRGDVPYGFMKLSSNFNDNWMAGAMVTSSGIISGAYPLSGSSAYYSGSGGAYTLAANEDILLSSIYANISSSGSYLVSPVKENGYFIGNKLATTVFPTTEYTLQFSALYKNLSGSVILQGNAPTVDIYIVGTTIISQNPLGQFIGRLSPTGDSALFQNKQLNFTPQMASAGDVYLRFVVSNGYWYFSDISLKPAEDPRFAPDEIQVFIPNTDYYKQVIQYKAEFFTIDNNSVPITAVSTPTFFTGSVIDMGLLP